MSFEDNIRRVREQIEGACARAGRPAAEVTLVAVTKTYPVAAIHDAVTAGIRDIGESRIQEAQDKFIILSGASVTVRKHLVGHLQTNKAGKAAAMFDVVQSLDSLRLAEELDRHAKAGGKVLDCLLEIKVSAEAAKFGMDPDEAGKFVESVRSLNSIRVTGLMTMAPYLCDVEQRRPYFARARQAFDRIRSAYGSQDFNMLSMGMSDDFEIAIEEGSTMVRIGSALFGERAKQ